MYDGWCMLVNWCWIISSDNQVKTEIIQRYKNEEFTFEEAFDHMPKLKIQLESRPRIYDDYEEEEEEDEYVDSDSEDDLPTHEIEASWKWINLW